MRPSIWLIDTRSGEQAPLAAGPGIAQPAALVARRPPPRLHLDRRGRRGAAFRALDGERRVGPDHRPARFAGKRRLVAGRPPDRLHDVRPGRGPEAGRACRPSPKARNGREPLEIHNDVTYRTDEEGYLKPGFSHIFLVASDGGAPRQLSFGSVHDNGPLSWTPRRPLDPVQQQPLARTGSATPLNSEVYALDVATGDDPRADRPRRARTPSRSCRPTAG